jgi:peptidoglycan/xylan/chitin deacetylase (PgdA/CDA1 family)
MASSLQAVNIAITIDDYPLPDSGIFTVKERAQRFIDACAQYNCKTVFFCVGQHCKDRDDASLLSMLSDKGHFIGNHSMNHRRLSGLSLSEFEKEIMDTDALLKSCSTVRKWFRYPYLDYGMKEEFGGSLEKLIQSYELLGTLKYTDAYITINTFDFALNKRLQEAIKQGKTINYDALRTVYLTLLEEWIEHYIALYQRVVQHDVVHTILLHDNDLNALYLADVLALIQKKGWHIVSPEAAFRDVSWRKQLLSKFEMLKQKPASLNYEAIDKKLAENNVVTS